MADDWAANAAGELGALFDEYQAVEPEVLTARYGFVVAVDSPSGPLVLRGSPDPNGPAQAAVSLAMANLGISPVVHQVVTSNHGTWTVLERIVPGYPLYVADLSTLPLAPLFEPLAAMRYHAPPAADMPSIFDWLRDRLEDDQLTDRRAGTEVATPAERRFAATLLDALARTSTPALCHGDASLGNVICQGSQRWAFIDPRGMVGESAYDVAVLAIRVARYREESGLISQVARLSQVEWERVEAWKTIAETARV